LFRIWLTHFQESWQERARACRSQINAKDKRIIKILLKILSIEVAVHRPQWCENSGSLSALEFKVEGEEGDMGEGSGDPKVHNSTYY